MEAILRIALIATGSYLFLRGTWGIIWEFWSWAVLGSAGERALLVGSDPRIRFFSVYLAMSAAGATAILCAI